MTQAEITAIANGYEQVKTIPFKGVDIVCGLIRFAFTTGLVIGIDSVGYYGRYCFHTRKEASDVLAKLEHIPYDMHIPGNWIKYKGDPYELRNPKYNEYEDVTDGPSPELLALMHRPNNKG